MATDAVKARLERIGQGVLQPAAGLAALGRVLQHFASAAGTVSRPLTVLTVNPFHWDRWEMWHENCTESTATT